MHLARILAGAVGSALLQPVVAAPAAHSEQPSSLTRRHLQGHGGHGGHGGHKGCPPLNRGSYNIQQYQLYPENADWDEDSCLVYFGWAIPPVLAAASMRLPQPANRAAPCGRPRWPSTTRTRTRLCGS